RGARVRLRPGLPRDRARRGAPSAPLPRDDRAALRARRARTPALLVRGALGLRRELRPPQRRHAAHRVGARARAGLIVRNAGSIVRNIALLLGLALAVSSAHAQETTPRTPPPASVPATEPTEPVGPQPFGASLFSGSYAAQRENGL